MHLNFYNILIGFGDAFFFFFKIIIGAVAIFTGFTNGVGQIWLDDVACVGTEARLIDCPARTIGTHNCVHSEDVGVRCTTTTGMYISV